MGGGRIRRILRLLRRPKWVTAAVSSHKRQDPRAALPVANYPLSDPLRGVSTQRRFAEGPRLRGPTPPPTKTGNGWTIAVISLHATPAKIEGWGPGGSGMACEVHEPAPKYRTQRRHGVPSKLPHTLGTEPAIQQCGERIRGFGDGAAIGGRWPRDLRTKVQTRPLLCPFPVAPGLLLTASRLSPGPYFR